MIRFFTRTLTTTICKWVVSLSFDTRSIVIKTLTLLIEWVAITELVFVCCICQPY